MSGRSLPAGCGDIRCKYHAPAGWTIYLEREAWRFKRTGEPGEPGEPSRGYASRERAIQACRVAAEVEAIRNEEAARAAGEGK